MYIFYAHIHGTSSNHKKNLQYVNKCTENGLAGHNTPGAIHIQRPTTENENKNNSLV